MSKKKRGLEVVTNQLLAIYDNWKSAEKKKNELRDEFFKLAVDENSRAPLSRKTVTIIADSEDEVRNVVEDHHKRFSCEALKEKTPGVWSVVLIERPEFKSFVYINDSKETPILIQRRVDDGSPSLDNERIIKEDPELWKSVSEIPDRNFLVDLILCFSYREQIVKRLEDVYPLHRRLLRPFKDLSSEEIPRLQSYVSYGKPKIVLGAPRPAKDEELDTSGE